MKLIKYVQISPKDIIRPKSITGFIPLVYRVAKANIVVRAEYKHGLYIFCKHNVIDEKELKFLLSLKICLYLTTMCTVIDNDKIKINIIKLEDITVTFHCISDNKPVINTKIKIQLLIQTIIQLIFLKIKKRTIKINRNAPAPKMNISFFTNEIVSSAIIGTPPR